MYKKTLFILWSFIHVMNPQNIPSVTDEIKGSFRKYRLTSIRLLSLCSRMQGQRIGDDIDNNKSNYSDFKHSFSFSF